MSQINLYSKIMRSWKILLKKYRQRTRREFAREKSSLLEEIVRLSGNLDLDAVRTYVSEVEEAMKEVFPRVFRVDARSLWRSYVHAKAPFGMIPFELGIAFDFLLNVPYLPSSSIKGALRRHLANPDLLGTTEVPSKVVITDAYPIAGRILLHPEVLTPHYPRARTELDVQPNPLVHLVIAPNVLFRFYMGLTEELDGVEIGGLRTRCWRKDESGLLRFRDSDCGGEAQ